MGHSRELSSHSPQGFLDTGASWALGTCSLPRDGSAHETGTKACLCHRALLCVWSWQVTQRLPQEEMVTEPTWGGGQISQGAWLGVSSLVSGEAGSHPSNPYPD